MVKAPTDRDRGGLPPELLAAPTLGAVMRRDGITGWCPEAQVAFATELIQEAIRRAAMDRLEGIFDGLIHGAQPRHIAQRLRRLADDIDPPDLATDLQEAA
jgi:hypothetical protein